MKYLILLCVLLSSKASHAQSFENYPLIGFGCGKAGMASASVQQISYLLNTGHLDSIRTLMNSADPALKYLCIKVCECKVQKNELVLTPQEKTLVELARRSDEKIEYCSGCTFQQIYSLSELFNDNTIGLNESLSQWIKRISK